MKKIAITIIAIMISSTLSAADIIWSGWIETLGTVTAQNHESYTGDKADKKKPKLELGATTADITVGVYGSDFSGTSTIEVYAENYAGILNEAGDEVAPKPVLTNTYIWSDFLDGMIRLYGGYAMQAIDYSPLPAVEGDFFFGGSAFGNGYGAYDYHCGWTYTKPLTGVIAEIKIAELSFASVFEVGDEIFLEDIAENDIILNAKYNLGALTAYAGFDFNKDDNALWVAASTELLDGLLGTDLKYETNFVPEAKEQVHTISLNLIGNLDMMKVATETNIGLYNNEDNSDAKSMDYIVSAQIIPFITPIVTMAGNISVLGNNAKDSNLVYNLGADLTKNIGNVANTLQFKVNSNTSDEPVTTLAVGYAINMWF